MSNRTHHPPPRYWKRTIETLTGLCYCDRSCPCGEANGLWWWPGIGGGGLPDWLPGWTNGIDTASLWDWLVESGHAGPRPAGGG